MHVSRFRGFARALGDKLIGESKIRKVTYTCVQRLSATNLHLLSEGWSLFSFDCVHLRRVQFGNMSRFQYKIFQKAAHKTAKLHFLKESE